MGKKKKAKQPPSEGAKARTAMIGVVCAIGGAALPVTNVGTNIAKLWIAPLDNSKAKNDVKVGGLDIQKKQAELLGSLPRIEVEFATVSPAVLARSRSLGAATSKSMVTIALDLPIARNAVYAPQPRAGEDDKFVDSDDGGNVTFLVLRNVGLTSAADVKVAVKEVLAQTAIHFTDSDATDSTLEQLLAAKGVNGADASYNVGSIEPGSGRMVPLFRSPSSPGSRGGQGLTIGPGRIVVPTGLHWTNALTGDTADSGIREFHVPLVYENGVIGRG